jgi:lipopolysaccharide heptosyltransferase I
VTLQRVLVIRLSSIGDIVHTLPAVAALGRTFPEAEIHWAIERRYAELLEGNPYIRRRVELDTRGMRMGLEYGKAALSLARLTRQSREFDYDAVVDFQGLIKTALLARLTRSPVRLGFAKGWLREPAAALFYTDCVAPNGRRHVVDLNLALAERLGAGTTPREFPLPADEEAEKHIEGRLQGLEGREFVILHPGAGWKAKRWPPESYADLIRRLEAEFPFEVLLTGSPAEQPLIQEILARAAGTRADYFPCTLRPFIALARRARLFVGGDTGPMHLAGAVGTPVVAIFDASDPLNTVERNGPFNPDDITITGLLGAANGRHNKHQDYLRGVSVDAVLEAIRERWKRANG